MSIMPGLSAKYHPPNIRYTVYAFPWLFLALVSCPVIAAPEVMAIMSKATSARDAVGFSALRRVELFQDGRCISTVEQSVLRAPGRLERIETLAPEALRGRLAVSDGHNQWEYYPHERRCIQRILPSKTEINKHRQLSLLRIRNRLRPRHVSTGQLLGRKVYHVLLSSPAGHKAHEAWVDAATYVELRADSYLAGGSLGSRTTITQINFNPRYTNSSFTFAPPRGTNIERVSPPIAKCNLPQAEKRAGFRAYLPRYLPPGYALCDEETGLLKCPTQGLIIWTVYGNGVDSFSLFQSKCEADLRSGTPRDCHCWRLDEFLFTLVGHMESSEAYKIQKSVRLN